MSESRSIQTSRHASVGLHPHRPWGVKVNLLILLMKGWGRLSENGTEGFVSVCVSVSESVCRCVSGRI